MSKLDRQLGTLGAPEDSEGARIIRLATAQMQTAQGPDTSRLAIGRTLGEDLPSAGSRSVTGPVHLSPRARDAWIGQQLERWQRGAGPVSARRPEDAVVKPIEAAPVEINEPEQVPAGITSRVADRFRRLFS